MTAMRHAQHWIGGAQVQSGSEGQSRNPATGEVIGTYCDADAATAAAAISAAYDCFEQSSWRLDPMTRATALTHLADIFEARVDDIVALHTLENDKLDAEARRETNHVSRGLWFSAGLAVQGYGRVLDPELGQQSMSIRQPVGVAGLSRHRSLCTRLSSRSEPRLPEILIMSGLAGSRDRWGRSWTATGCGCWSVAIRRRWRSGR